MGNLCAIELDNTLISKQNIIAEPEPSLQNSDDSFHLQQLKCSPRCNIFSFLLPAQEIDTSRLQSIGNRVLKMYLDEEAQEVQFS